MSDTHEPEGTRRDFIYYATAGAGVVATGAAGWGLVNQVVPAAQLEAAAAALAEKVVAKSAVAIATGKRMVYAQLEKGMSEAYDYAAHVMATNMMAEDAGEGIDAFIAKRKPDFSKFS